MSALVFDSEKGNQLSITLKEVINKVSSISVKDDQGTAVKYGTKINSAKEYTYYVTKFAKEATDEDLNNVNWVFWLNKTQDKLSEKSFPIATTGEKTDQEEDYLLTESDEKKDYKAVKDNGILSAKLEISELTIGKKKQKTAVLKVKFSKWLDGELVKVEAAIEDTFTLSSNNDSVASREVLASPEITEIYWTTKDGERIEKTGYSEDITMHLISLGLKGKTIEAQTYEKDHDSNESMSEGDQVDWENNSFKVEGRNFERQFKVASKESQKKAREEDVASDNPPFTSFFDFMKRAEREESTEDLELYINVLNADALKLDATKDYGGLVLTPKEEVVDAYFAKVEKESMAINAPMSKGANKKGKVEKHEKLTEGVIGQKITLVAECDNINGKEVIFQIFEKDALLGEKDAALKVDQNGTEMDEIAATVEDGYATVEIKLRPKADADFKKWLTTLKIDGKPEDRKKSKLYIKSKVRESPVVAEFYKDDGFKVISTNWHEPVDDPQIAMYNQHGTEKAKSSTFGNGRGRFHSGMDLFSLEGENVYACLDAEVHSAQEWKRKSGKSGYGHNITLKVSNPQEFINRKREYSKAFTSDLLKKPNFDENSDVFLLRYCHLEDILVKVGDKVKAGEKIGTSGTSGVIAGTKDPHVHFNIYSSARVSNNLVNPAYYVYWKEVDDLTDADKKTQKDRMEDKTVSANATPTISLKDPKRAVIN